MYRLLAQHCQAHWGSEAGEAFLLRDQVAFEEESKESDQDLTGQSEQEHSQRQEGHVRRSGLRSEEGRKPQSG